MTTKAPRRSQRVAKEYVRKRVASLMPSPENLLLYRPVEADQGIDALAASIKKHGCVALDITQDNFIVGGHRRLEALRRIGQRFVDCRVLPVRRSDMTTDDYVKLLREHNHQRDKSVAEKVREALVDIDPAEAHRRLLANQSQSVNAPEYNGVAAVTIEGVKRRHRISGQKAEHVEYIKKVVFEDLKDFWPLTVRGVHYPLLNYGFLRNIPQKIPYRNDGPSYDATAELITRLRLSSILPWHAFDDFTRPSREFRAYSGVRQYLEQKTAGLFTDYRRDLMQTQPNYIEVLCEKNTVYHMVLRVTSKYQIRTSSGRGFNGIDPWHDLYLRYRRSGKQRLIVILLSDYDPEGEQIVQVGGRTLRDDFGVDPAKLTVIKAGVTREQIRKYDLPAQNFAKETSSNHKWFVERNGGDAVFELEALSPRDMMNDLDTVIRKVIDVDLYNREVAAEREEARYLEAAQVKLAEALRGLCL